jgi:hypothetical protein
LAIRLKLIEDNDVYLPDLAEILDAIVIYTVIRAIFLTQKRNTQKHWKNIKS